MSGRGLLPCHLALTAYRLIEGLRNPKGTTDVEEYYSTKGLDEIVDMRLSHSSGLLGKKWEGECSFTVWEFGTNVREGECERKNERKRDG